MVMRAVKIVIAAVVAIAVAYPVSRELSARAAIQNGMVNLLNANDVAAFKAWPGSAESFVAMLHDHCMRAHGGDESACTRYLMAKE
jgi:hypothetical protein